MTTKTAKFRHKLCNEFPELAIWIAKHQKGECNHCGKCCILNGKPCPVFKNNRCAKYASRPLSCKVAPFPTDLKHDPKFSECSIYYDDEEEEE